MVKFMQNFVKKIDLDESLSGFLKNRSKEMPKSLGSPTKYFFISSLCDPMNDFIKKKLPKQEISLDSIKRKTRGNKLHAFAKEWFNKMSGYESFESILDGIYFGLPVVGRIDAKINDSIVELKTKEKIPETAEEIIEMHPGDIEQLCFYAVIDPTKPIKNYLIYLSHGKPLQFKAFEIKINNHNNIKGILKKRMDDLRWALENNDPSSLGCCRYCWDSCSLKRDKICEWYKSQKKECEIIDYIEITENISFAQKFKEAMDLWSDNFQNLFVYNILFPRKYFHQKILGLEDPFEESAESLKNKDYIKKLVFDLKKSYDSKSIEIPKPFFSEIFFSPNNWINYKSSSNQKGDLIPFIACISNQDSESALSSPCQYRLAELGIITSIFNKSQGLIFIYYPKIGDGKYKVFRVEYSFDGSCKKTIKEIINLLKSENLDDIQNLSLCPFYCHRNCNFNNICYTKEDNGLTINNI